MNQITRRTGLMSGLALMGSALAGRAIAQDGSFSIQSLDTNLRSAVLGAREAQTAAIRAAARARSGGQGTIDFLGSAGDTYIGEGSQTSSGYRRHGYGLLTWSDGEFYAGQHRTNAASAARAGDKHGHGVYGFAGGNLYEGQFQDDDFHGYGVMWNARGQVIFSGAYRAGQAVR